METAIGHRDSQSTEPLSLSVSRQSLLTATAISAEKRGFPPYYGAGGCSRSRPSVYAISLRKRSTCAGVLP